MSTTRALPTALFSLTLAVSLAVGCGSIDVTKQDGSAGSGAGGATGAAGSGAGGATGAAGSSAGRGGSDSAGRGGGAAGSSAGRGGSDGAGTGGRGGGAGSVGGAGSGGVTGAGGRGGAAGSSAGRGGTGGAAGAAGSSAGRGGAAGSGTGGRGGAAGSGAAGRGGAGGGPCICPTIIKPVCGVNGMTYDNDCQAACVNVAVAYDGMCVMECKSNADCVHYPDGVGDCCGACLPTSAARPGMVSCFGPCTMPITCPCVAGKCLATPAGGTAASQ